MKVTYSIEIASSSVEGQLDIDVKDCEYLVRCLLVRKRLENFPKPATYWWSTVRSMKARWKKRQIRYSKIVNAHLMRSRYDEGTRLLVSNSRQEPAWIPVIKVRAEN